MIMSRAKSKERPVAPTLSPIAPILHRPPGRTYQNNANTSYNTRILALGRRSVIQLQYRTGDPEVKIIDCSDLNIIGLSCHEKV